MLHYYIQADDNFLATEADEILLTEAGQRILFEVEVIGVGGPQVTNIFLFNGVTEPPFPVQRRTA